MNAPAAGNPVRRDAERAGLVVTGATGFAGSHLIETLLRSQPSIAAWAHRNAPESTDPRVAWSTVDLTDPHAIEHEFRATQPSVIYHCAGLPHVAESWARAGDALLVNAFGTHLLLEAAARLPTPPLVIVVSSALVYRPSLTAMSESNPIGPVDPYGVSKLAQEMTAARSRTPTIVARPFNHAGPRQSSAFVTSSFARQIAEIETGRAAPVLRVGNLDAQRDITDVRDTVRAYQALATSASRGRTYNVCSGVAYRVGDLLEMLLGMSRTRVTVQQDPARMRPSDNPVVLGDRSRLTDETGWQPAISIEQTLGDLLDWWRAKIA